MGGGVGEAGGGAEMTANIRCSNGSKMAVETALDGTVGELKAVLAGRCDMPAEQQRLTYKGRILKDKQTLRSYDALRATEREMTNAMRGIEKEIGALQLEEKKLVAEIKRTAKMGNKAATKFLARQLIRLRQLITNLQGSRAQMRGIATQAQAMYATTSVAAGIKGATKAMRAMNKADRPAAVEMERSLNGVSKAMSETDEHSLTMIILLMECAMAISVDNLEKANKMILELTLMASPYSPSSAERVVAYFTQAMASRIMSSCLGNDRFYNPIVPHKSILAAFQAFNTISPFIKFAHFTANQAILEAFHHKDKVHIIDLDIMQGLQWPALFCILAIRADGPPHVRMTGMGTSLAALKDTGRQLSGFAQQLGLPFKFHPIAMKPGDVDPSLIQAWRGEAIAIHWLKHTLYDAAGPDWKTMRLLKLLAPTVITLVEQEMAYNGSFLDRFLGSLHYYSTMFDALGASLTYDDVLRHWVEHGLLLREISNILSVGGRGRSGEEKLGSCRVELMRHRFM